MAKNMGFDIVIDDDDLLNELGGPSKQEKGNTADDIMRELGLDPNADDNMDDDALLAEINRKASMSSF
jgi:hypothetical protein